MKKSNLLKEIKCMLENSSLPGPVFLQEGLFPPVLTIQQFKCFQPHLWLTGRDPFQLC